MISTARGQTDGIHGVADDRMTGLTNLQEYQHGTDRSTRTPMTTASATR